VVKARRNGLPYAVKAFIEKDEPPVPEYMPFKLETEILRRLDHPRIPHLVEAFSLGNVNYIVQEFIGGRPLSHIIENGVRLSEAEVRGIIFQLLSILNDLHCPDKRKNSVVHRDLRLSNVLLKENKVYLIDFGFARFTDRTQFPFCPDPLERKFAGVFNGKTPEAVKRELKSKRAPGAQTYVLLRKEVSPNSDLFGAGVVAVDLFSGWVEDESFFDLPWQDVLPISDSFKMYLEKLLSRKGGFKTALEALETLDRL
jgi:serine/threonine protein kinase